MKTKLFAGALCVGLIFSSLLHASVTIDRTRLIYQQDDREADVRLRNDGPKPVVVQSWLDNGDATQAPADIPVPFVLMPPIARVEAAHGQVLRVVYTGEPLPHDKESVFWLNVLEIPPKEQPAESRNVLQFAIRSRIKLFYRPKGLSGDAADAPSKLTWKIVAQGDGYALEASNPTAYHVSLNRVALQLDSRIIEAGDGMVSPGETQRYALKGVQQAPAAGRVKYSFIDDWGAIRDNGAAELH
ncbi:fimbrial biogenesis chaperone [Dyella acidiphila]|uniref:Molecular chaperone n=1 Tax=Dyella acidiphila TaxID=2775866 RepID=A0ABR9GBL2_9GAMM|nr:molecular chaperone [Dyella acidiphila]MBE1161437.1 molecular chaperone [Dyella acidiphila]